MHGNTKIEHSDYLRRKHKSYIGYKHGFGKENALSRHQFSFYFTTRTQLYKLRNSVRKTGQRQCTTCSQKYGKQEMHSVLVWETLYTAIPKADLNINLRDNSPWIVDKSPGVPVVFYNWHTGGLHSRSGQRFANLLRQYLHSFITPRFIHQAP
jgi:hypothetical protein